jgi:hypothetical protein
MILKESQLNKITYNLPQTWEFPFYEFVGGKIGLIEFERYVYELFDLESIIGETAYVNLISFRYSDPHVYNEVVKFILEEILFQDNTYKCKLFTLIGDFYQGDIKSKIKNAKSLPEAILNIFEGAHIHVKWMGVDNPACDIEFFKKSIPIKRTNRGCLNSLPLNTVIIGYACNSDILLLMDDEGIVYICLQIIDKVYCGGGFFDALNRLFFGFEYGELLPPPPPMLLS